MSAYPRNDHSTNFTLGGDIFLDGIDLFLYLILLKIGYLLGYGFSKGKS